MDPCFWWTIFVVSLALISLIDSVVKTIAKAKVLKSGNQWPEEKKGDDE